MGQRRDWRAEGIAEVKWGGAEKLDEAVQQKQCNECWQNGAQLYSWQETNVGERGSVDHHKQIYAGEKSVDEQTYLKLVGMLNSLKVGFVYNKKDDQAFIVLCCHRCGLGHTLGLGRVGRF